MAPRVQPGKDILNNILSGGLIAHDQNREAEQLSVVTPEQLGQLGRGSLPAVISASRRACAISDQHGRRQLPAGKPGRLVGHRSPPFQPGSSRRPDRVWLILCARLGTAEVARSGLVFIRFTATAGAVGVYAIVGCWRRAAPGLNRAAPGKDHSGLGATARARGDDSRGNQAAEDNPGRVEQ
jgi:hypothetical protein